MDRMNNIPMMVSFIVCGYEEADIEGKWVQVEDEP
jgi:hypothetical protein